MIPSSLKQGTITLTPPYFDRRGACEAVTSTTRGSANIRVMFPLSISIRDDRVTSKQHQSPLGIIGSRGDRHDELVVGQIDVLVMRIKALRSVSDLNDRDDSDQKN